MACGKSGKPLRGTDGDGGSPKETGGEGVGWDSREAGDRSEGCDPLEAGRKGEGCDLLEASTEGKSESYDPLEAGVEGEDEGCDPVEAGSEDEGEGCDLLEAEPLTGKHRQLSAWKPTGNQWLGQDLGGSPTEGLEPMSNRWATDWEPLADVNRAADWEPLADVDWATDWEPLADVNQAADKGAGTGVSQVVSHAVTADNPAGVGWVIDTGAGVLGRHGSEALGRHHSGALNSSEDGALGSGEEQQNREPDLSEPGRDREHRFLEGGTLYARRVPKNRSTGDLSGTQDEVWAGSRAEA